MTSGFGTKKHYDGDAFAKIYTLALADIAAFVEELETKVYKVSKAKMAAYLEDKLGIDRVSDTPTGEMLETILREVKRAMWGVTKRRFPSMERRMILAARERREKRQSE